jgi:hypothetical protein
MIQYAVVDDYHSFEEPTVFTFTPIFTSTLKMEAEGFSRNHHHIQNYNSKITILFFGATKPKNLI